MGELELTEEERALLAAAEAPENPVVSEPVAVVDDGEIIEPPTVAEPELPKVIARGSGRRRARQELPDEPQVTAAEPMLPDEGNRTVPPAQHDYGDPWGRLPAQMRHMTDGTPAF